ncbi:NUDIX domain-containing protein [Candidatus Bipolaricaulota bacterium]|nr:NUDIX domain-containing protein [Candidatus Bipolaricaulota bacterium]
MPDERASGFILFRERDREREYLIIRHRGGGHWGFPKGHIEPGEDEQTAAQREVEEEVGITRLAPVPGFVERIAYRFPRGGEVVHKEVTLFLAEVDEDGVPGKGEVEAIVWLPLSEALDRLTYPEQREALHRAAAFLRARRGG